MKIVLTLIIALVIAAPTYAAPRQYRCQGMVRYTPCTVKVTSPNLKNARAGMAPKHALHNTIPTDWYAEVITQDFSRLTKRDGLWKGRVKGNGMVHLTLVIFRSGVEESRTYMGGVKLANKDTAFRFRAAIPAGKEWSWQVVAFNSASAPA